MKKLLLAVVLLIPFFSKAQSTGPYNYKSEDKYLYYGEVVKVDTALTAADLYKDAKVFISKLSLLSTNFTTDDKTSLIIADVTEKGGFKNATGIGSDEPMTLKYTIKLELKQGRYRYTFDNIVITYSEGDKSTAHTLYDLDKSASGVLGNPRSKRVLKAMDAEFESNINLLTNTMKKKSDDF
jgi:hypothetical protein